MTDKELVLKTINYLKPKETHTQIKEFWNSLNLTEEKQLDLRTILLRGELINLYDNDHWSFKLTAKGIIAIPSDFSSKGYFIDRTDKIIRYITLLGIVPIIYYAIEILKDFIIFTHFIVHSCCPK